MLLLMGVWGSIAYQLFGDSNSTEAEANSEGALDRLSTQAAQTKYDYVANVRDPFSLFVPTKKKEILKQAITPPQTPVWTPPPFKLTGIVVNKRKRTAMLESSDGSVYFLKEGDSLGGLKIRNIDQNAVTYLYLNEKRSWTLER